MAKKNPILPLKGERTPKQVGKVIGLSAAEVRWLTRGPLDAYVRGKRLAINTEQLERFVRGRW